MPSLKTLLLPTFLSLPATTTATCPEGWGSYGSDGSICCPGSMISDGDGVQYCCVADKPNISISIAPIFPTGISLMAKDKRSVENSCAAEIPFTASDYSSLVSSASAKAAAATMTGPSSNEAATTTGPSSNGASSSSSGSASSTTNAAMPVAMAEGIVLSGAAVAAALFML